jgi:hypothetical protein
VHVPPFDASSTNYADPRANQLEIVGSWGGTLIQKNLKFHVRDVQKKHTEQEVISELIAYCSTGDTFLLMTNAESRLQKVLGSKV